MFGDDAKPPWKDGPFYDSAQEEVWVDCLWGHFPEEYRLYSVVSGYSTGGSHIENRGRF